MSTLCGKTFRSATIHPTTAQRFLILESLHDIWHECESSSKLCLRRACNNCRSIYGGFCAIVLRHADDVLQYLFSIANR
ncbi:hypothetical protein WJX77_007956 [Trebouxia sp. C0004]